MLSERTIEKLAECVEAGDVSVLSAPERKRGEDLIRVAHAYSVGMTRIYGMPELLVLGLSEEKAKEFVINACSFFILNRDKFPAPGQPLHGVLEGRPVYLRRLALADAARILIGANPYAAPGGVEACQLLWPDPSGRFPGQEGADPRYGAVQDPYTLARSMALT